jgi:3-oxoadipate enol-lactonase
MTVALHAVESGSGDAVVLVHAIGCDHRMWDSLAASLSPQFRVIRVDVRGHGASPVPKGPYSLKELSDDVAALLDRRGITRAHWVGLSMGGMIGQAFALDHPDRLERLVLANTTSSYGAEGHKLWDARIKAVNEGGMEAIVDMVMTRYFPDTFHASHPSVVKMYRERVAAISAAGYVACCGAIRELDFTHDLGRITARTLAIAGEKDAGTPTAMLEEIVRGIPGARLAVIPGASHLSAVDSAGEFNALVGSFLAEP